MHKKNHKNNKIHIDDVYNEKVLKVKIVFNMLYKLIKNPEASKKR
jgi:hypothetical protein